MLHAVWVAKAEYDKITDNTQKHVILLAEAAKSINEGDPVALVKWDEEKSNDMHLVEAISVSAFDSNPNFSVLRFKEIDLENHKKYMPKI
jgi:hypothetical protein